MALYFCVRIRARCGAIPRLGRGQSPASNLQKFPYHLKKAEGGAGEAAKKLKGNFGVAKLSFLLFLSFSNGRLGAPTKDTP